MSCSRDLGQFKFQMKMRNFAGLCNINVRYFVCRLEISMNNTVFLFSGAVGQALSLDKRCNRGDGSSDAWGQEWQSSL